MNVKWIVFEAGDGAGKSTQIKMLEDYYYNERNISPFVCRQPGNTKLGDAIRSIVLSDKYSNDMCSEAERFLFAADNAQFIEEIIIPNMTLNTDNIIIQDRYTPYSNFAYGVYGNGVSKDFMKLLEIATRGYYPDIVFLLDLDPVLAQERIVNRLEAITRIDKLGLDFHKRVRDGYLDLAESNPEKFRIIDASKNQEIVHQNIIDELLKFEDL